MHESLVPSHGYLQLDEARPSPFVMTDGGNVYFASNTPDPLTAYSTL